jgi:penicillin amidase
MSTPTPELPETRPDLTGDDARHARLYRNLAHARHSQQRTSQRLLLRRLLYAALVFALVLVIALIVTAIAMRHAMRASLPQLDGNIAVAGLSASVTVTRDAQGVPSIHASTLDDLLFTQGYITASDRLFQMDALRRHGAGDLAEILGPSLIAHDREQRYLQLRAAADRAIAVLPQDQLRQLDAYARGVNAFIAAHSGSTTTANTLPVEFHLLHYTPAPWSPRDSLLIALVMSQDLSTEFPSKLNREVLSAHLPASLIPDLYPVGSWRDRPPTQNPTDLTAPTEVEQIPLDRTQSLNRAPQIASPHDTYAIYTDLRTQLCEGCRAGSNNWAVAGAHTATGAPLLSNDMHLGLTAPDIWYEAGLHVDKATTGPSAADPPAFRAGLNVTGFTLPGVPFVIVGRNPFVSWAFTNSGADVQDLIIEHLRGSGADTEYERPDHTWALAGHQIERIHVRAGRDVTLDILTTTHTIGNTTIPTPIISPLYKSERRALALAWTVYDPSTVTSPLYAVNTATDAASLVAAFAGFGSVSQNLVFADAHHIGYHTIGRIPIRGLAIQRPRPTQPFVLPDNTPPEDEDDESGSLASPDAATVSHLTSAMWDPSHATSPYHLQLVATPSPLLVHRRHPRATPSVAKEPKAPSHPQTNDPTPSTPTLPASPTTAYTIGNPISPVPVDALDTDQIWSGYIPYDALPSVLDPSTGFLATANARITPDDYPYFIANDWVDAYRVERINHLLSSQIAAGNNLTPADMLRIQTDTHSEFDLLVAQRLAYAIDHSAFAKKDAHLQQAANLLRDWDGNVSTNSPAAAIVAVTRAELWPMLLSPHLRDSAAAAPGKHHKVSNQQIADLLELYTWEEKTTALEQILQHTPARWLPRSFANWNDFLSTAVQQALHHAGAPGNLTTFTYGSIHTIDIQHPIFGSHGPISHLLGVPTGSGSFPYAGDGTTVKQAGRGFGPSERFTADLSNPDNTHANITTGESGNPASPWFLDQFQPWLQGTTFTLPLNHPAATHTLTLTPQ